MQQGAFPRWLIVTLGLVLVILLGGGIWFYASQEQALRRKAEDDLQAIAQLKVNQIVDWRTQRLGDAAILTESPFFTAGTVAWLANPQAGQSADILIRLRSLQNHYSYDDVLLADTSGQVQLSLSGQQEALHEASRQALTEALRSGQPVMTDLHSGPGNLPPHIDIIAPLFLGSDPTAAPLGAVILQVNASHFLYPLIQSWPMPSDSAETLIIRRDGNSVLFLNELRFQPDAALSLRIPLSETTVPAVMAVLGGRGIVQGTDYRGIEVLSVISVIPHSSWFMIAKIDTADIFADWRSRSILILLLIVGLIAMVAATGGVIWQQAQKMRYQALFQMERARHESEERYQALFDDMLEGCQIIGFDWRYLYINDSAAQHGRQPKEALLGHTMLECYPGIENTAMFAALKRCMEERTVQHLENEFTYDDGSTTWFDLRVQPVLEGIFILSLDITERMETQRQTAELAAIIRSSQDAIISKDLDGIITSWNAGAQAIYGYTADEVVGKPIALLASPEYWDEIRDILERIKRGERVANQETVRVTKDGRRIHVALSVSPIRNSDSQIVAASTIARDITARKQAETALQESEERFRRAVADAPFPMLIHAEDGEIVIVNQVWTDLTGYTHADMPTVAAWAELAYGERKAMVQAKIDRLYDLSGREDEGEYVITTRGGDKRVWDFSSSPIGRLPDGRRLVLSIAMDITARKRGEIALQESETRYKSMFENNHAVMLIIDPEDVRHRRCQSGRVRLLRLAPCRAVHHAGRRDQHA